MPFSMDEKLTFGEWLTRRRKSLNLTRDALAKRVPCSAITIRRLESGSLRASSELAKSLAIALVLPENEYSDFIAFARGGRDELSLDVPMPKGRAVSPVHLPAPMTRLIGRQREVAALTTALRNPGVRLMTLTGPPGAGKTRLSLAVAKKLERFFRDGIYFVPLAPVSDPRLVLDGIARALGIKEAKDGISRALIEFLQDKSILLVLDNFEHLIPAAPQVTELLTAAPHIKALVSSREILHLYGEHEFPVPPLEVMDVRHLPTTETLSLYKRFAAIKFFMERASAIQPEFKLTRENAADVARICAWLDGLPLAIEIAAAQIRWHAPAQLYAQLQDRLASLTGGPRDLTPRQQSLRGAMEWSYDLLDATERRLFCMLAVFSGGCAEETACEAYESIHVFDESEDRHTILGAKLRSLVEKSLLRQERVDGGEARLTMLETVRDYALDQLRKTGELARVRAWHGNYYLKFAQEAYPYLTQGGEQAFWLAKMEHEYNNLRAALSWAIETPGYATLAMELGRAVHPFWQIRSSISEARYWLDQILALDVTPSPLRAKLLGLASDYSSFQGEYETAGRFEDEGLQISRALGDEEGIYYSMDGLAMLAGMQGDYIRAAELLEQTLAYRRRGKDIVRLASTINNLAIASRRCGKLERARNLYEEAVTMSRPTQNQYLLAHLLTGLAEVHADLGEQAASLGYLQESLSLVHKLGNMDQVVNTLEALASLFCQFGAVELSIQLASASSKTRVEIGVPHSLAVRAEIDEFISRLRGMAGSQEFENAWARGDAMSLSQAVELALGGKNFPGAG